MWVVFINYILNLIASTLGASPTIVHFGVENSFIMVRGIYLLMVIPNLEIVKKKKKRDSTLKYN